MNIKKLPSRKVITFQKFSVSGCWELLMLQNKMLIVIWCLIRLLGILYVQDRKHNTNIERVWNQSQKHKTISTVSTCSFRWKSTDQELNDNKGFQLVDEKSLRPTSFHWSVSPSAGTLHHGPFLCQRGILLLLADSFWELRPAGGEAFFKNCSSLKWVSVSQSWTSWSADLVQCRNRSPDQKVSLWFW